MVTRQEFVGNMDSMLIATVEIDVAGTCVPCAQVGAHVARTLETIVPVKVITQELDANYLACMSRYCSSIFRN